MPRIPKSRPPPKPKDTSPKAVISAPAFLNPEVQAILETQAALEAELVDILDLPRTDPTVIAYIERLHAQIKRCVEFGQRVSVALNTPSN